VGVPARVREPQTHPAERRRVEDPSELIEYVI